ncbi:hypothetical protein S7711_05492 [Stachybotrys chartarum IBT 7711]|uniref:Rhodanese domain-containing protein n=1 Tax=Stachybotrys chartarum (strain CBS 109288 / IBT 7711) TaxID=1280523 RepID=A0A084AS00_STACB|nr:hypothetical protein S7711_05492 [Stachybotrys chartarum IBT 7711]KFA76127.1 hypothetical protein S40288_00333 [Stachybotrys chartarum IBT 40288]
MDNIDHLRREIAKREAELEELKSQLAVAESEERQDSAPAEWNWPLLPEEYDRYSRQMIVPRFGLQGVYRAPLRFSSRQESDMWEKGSRSSKVPGCCLQVAHSTARVGMSKVHSAISYLRELNPSITYKAHETHLSTHNAREIVSSYDLVLDCTDHPTSRYLISDICILLRKPLVSASAFQSSGQLIVLNSPPGKGPCYRCVFPKPPPPESVVGCGEGGIIGPVVGAMGVLQALEAIKLITRGGLEEGDDAEPRPTMMLLLTGMADAPFRSVRMKGKREGCLACAEEGGLTLAEMESSLDYAQFCGVSKPVELLQPEERISAEEYKRILEEEAEHLLIDVREKEHFDLCHLKGSINVPVQRFASHRGDDPPAWLPANLPGDSPIYVVCRVGNDSQVAARKLKDMGLDRGGSRLIGDIKGGMKAWRDAVDPTLPFV